MKLVVRKRRNSDLWAYGQALGLVAVAGALRVSLLHGSARIVAPFLVFYPAIALGSFLGGTLPGFAALALAVAITTMFFPGFPAPANWIWLGIVAPCLVLSFGRLKLLRDRSVVLTEESVRLRFVVDRASDWIFLTDETGAIQYVNQTASTQLGVPSEKLIGRPIESLTPESQRPRLRDLLARCRSEVVRPAEILFECGDHSLAAVELGCTAISDAGASIIHVAGRDITERNAIERRLAEARQWEGLRVLAGGVAHDFNNLLTSILGNASLARQTLPEGHPLDGLLQSIETASDRSAELVRMMLASSGYRSNSRETVRLDSALGRLLANRPLTPNVQVKTAAETVEIESDRETVETLLWALISNAAESYGSGGGEVVVSVRSAPEPPRGIADFEEGSLPPGGCAAIVVEDFGSGMTEQVLARAFEPFYTTKFTGRGLGLPAVRGIVRAHGGMLRLRSRPGAGTTAEIWLPVAGYHVSTSA